MLETEIENKRKEIHTDAYPMSIGEIINLYQDGDLDIHPEFQRVYRWTDTQKTRLIESILLGIPLPSFFVAQRDDGVWDVVDGLQRFSTIFSFLGIYKNENNEFEPPLRLSKTEYLPSLEGKLWIDLPKDIQRAFKREKADLKIIKIESDEATKYELFQRLNAFGSSLSEQEIRNSLLFNVNRSVSEWIKDLSEDKNFVETTPLTEKQINEQYRSELVVRFFVLKDCLITDLKTLPNVGEFLTQKLKEIATNDNFNKIEEADKFKKTFSLLKSVLGEDSFKKYSIEKEKYLGAFSLSVYEVIAIGLGKNIDNYTLDNTVHIDKIKEISKTLQSNPIYQNNSGTGLTAERRLPKLLPLGEDLFKL
jgi:hypothetical protein